MLIPYCDTAYITKIDHAYAADTYFPNLDQMDDWEMTEVSEEQTCFDLEYVFAKYERKIIKKRNKKKKRNFIFRGVSILCTIVFLVSGLCGCNSRW